MSNSIVVASFPAGCNNVRTDAKWQWDVGQTLQIDGLTLPTAFEAQFCLAGGEDNALAMVGENNLVTIPDELFEAGENIWCYIWLHDTEADGETVYKITIPVNERVKATDYTPAPTQLDAVEQAIVALNNAVDQTAADVVATGENAAAAAQSAENAAAASQAVQSMSVSADTLPAGSAATVEKTVDPDTGAVNLEFGIPTGATGAQGETGNGIQSVVLHSQSGREKTYRITFTDSTTFDFTVTDGNGIQSAILNADYTLTLTFQNGTSYTSPSIRGATGATGATGNGIQSIAKTGTSGNVDTYTITYTNGTTSTYTVTNGNVSSVAGKTGAVTLDADDVGYDDAETYSSGTVGAELTQLNQQLNDLDADVNDATTGLDTKAPVIINSASGAIASFSDGADSMPIKSLVVDVEPVQDLHGYDNPWPAGGGKNLLNNTARSATQSGVTFTVNTDGTITANGTATATMDFMIIYSSAVTALLEQGQSYVFSGCPSGGSQSTYNMRLNIIGKYDVGSGITVNNYDGTGLGNFSIRVNSGVTLNNLVFKPMIRLASESDATFAPYSNICPISGWTGAEVIRTGKNLLDKNTVTTGKCLTSEGSETSKSWGSYSDWIRVLPNTTYFISHGIGTNALSTGCYYDIYKTYISGIRIPGSDNISASITTPSNCGFVRLNIHNDQLDNAQLELGSTATTYEEFQGETLTVDWESEAGTVYGGTLDVTNGVLTVTDAQIASYNGETLPSTWISDRDVYAEGTTPTTGAQVVYKFETPITYQLTPQELETLLGQNNIWADTGDVAVEYCADTKLYIEELTKPTEDDMTANANIAANTFFMIGNSLYFSTAAIAAGATIIPGTNCNLVSLADALNQLNA